MAEKSRAAAQPETWRAGIASVRARFVRRAESLKYHRPFLAALDDTIMQWNDMIPEFRLSTKRDDIPDDMLPENTLYVMPPPLLSALREWRPVARFGETNLPTFREPIVYSSAPPPVTGQHDIWVRFLDDLATTWWPPERFSPSLLDPFGHPARRFVSACLVWNPESICAKKWMGGYPLTILHTSYNISGYGPPTPEPLLELYREYSENLTVSIERAFRAEGALTREAFDEIRRRVAAEAYRKRWEAFRRRSEVSYAYVPLPPGMTSEDWRALERQAVDAAEGLRTNTSPLHWRVLALQMHDAGVSTSQIAFDLGIPRWTVRRALKEP